MGNFYLIVLNSYCHSSVYLTVPHSKARFGSLPQRLASAVQCPSFLKGTITGPHSSVIQGPPPRRRFRSVSTHLHPLMACKLSDRPTPNRRPSQSRLKTWGKRLLDVLATQMCADALQSKLRASSEQTNTCHQTSWHPRTYRRHTYTTLIPVITQVRMNNIISPSIINCAMTDWSTQASTFSCSLESEQGNSFSSAFSSFDCRMSVTYCCPATLYNKVPTMIRRNPLTRTSTTNTSTTA